MKSSITIKIKILIFYSNDNSQYIYLDDFQVQGAHFDERYRWMLQKLNQVGSLQNYYDLLSRTNSKIPSCEKKIRKRTSATTLMELEQELAQTIHMVYCFVLQGHQKAFADITEIEWENFSRSFHQKSVVMLKYQAKSIEKTADRVTWTAEEEQILQASIDQNFNGEWINISKKIFYAFNGSSYKTSKQCREHWFNHLDAEKIKGSWNIQQDLIILNFVNKNSKHWSKIAQLLRRKRTQHSIKNRYYSLLRYAQKLEQRLQNEVDEQKIIQFMINQLESHQANQQSIIDAEEMLLDQKSCGPRPTDHHDIDQGWDLSQNLKGYEHGTPKIEFNSHSDQINLGSNLWKTNFGYQSPETNFIFQVPIYSLMEGASEMSNFSWGYYLPQSNAGSINSIIPQNYFQSFSYKNNSTNLRGSTELVETATELVETANL